MRHEKKSDLIFKDEKVIGSTGQWKQSGNPIKIDNKISTAATKKFHKQLLTRASESIDKDAIEVRDFSSITFTLDPSQMEYAKNRSWKII